MCKTTTLAVGMLLLSALFLLGYSNVGAQSVLPDPGTLKQMGSIAPGNTFLFKVTGKTTGGSVWGTDYYTTDSNLAMAAVHAGAIKRGQTGVIRVTLSPGLSQYAGSTRFGVKSSSWGSFELSFAVEAAEGVKAPAGNAGNAVLPNPGTLKALPNAAPGDVMLFDVTGAVTGGSVWGTKTYTTDSNLAMAAVHAGVLKPGQTGVIKVTILPGQREYVGSVKNGVSSAKWGSFDLSFKVERGK